MAEEVEQVFVWSGDDWIPVVTEGEATLPVSSEDGTVTLDSPAANTFAVMIGGLERTKINAASFLVRTDDINLIRANATFPPNSGNNINNKQMLMLKNTSKDGGRFSGLSFVHVFDSGTAGASGSIGVRDDDDGYNGTMLFTIKGETGTQTIDWLESTKDYAKFSVPVQTDTITSQAAAANDCVISISNSLSFEMQKISMTFGGSTCYLNTGDGKENTFTYNGLGQFIVGDTGAAGIGNKNAVAIIDANAPQLVMATSASDSEGVKFILDAANDVFFFNYLKSGGSFGIALANKRKLTISDDDIQAEAEYTPQVDASLATKKYVDSRIVTVTQVEYDAIPVKDPTRLYCIIG